MTRAEALVWAGLFLAIGLIRLWHSRRLKRIFRDQIAPLQAERDGYLAQLERYDAQAWEDLLAERDRMRAALAEIRAEGGGGVTDFYEPDEPVEDVIAAFDRAEKGVTAPPIRAHACEHVTATGLGLGGVVCPHGCEMTELPR